MNYYEVAITIQPITDETRDIVTANLGMLPFETFSETADGIYAYIPEKDYNELELIQALHNIKEIGIETNHTVKLIPDENWNSEWEKNFDPIVVADKCIVKAPFHKDLPSYPIEIIIEPKMSFGTGHHQTTYLMAERALNIDFKGKRVIDMGCGTGILALLASKLGAASVLAIDIDEWAYENGIENVQRNNISNIEVKQGDVTEALGCTCDIMFANINRNVLLADMAAYSKLVKKGEVLLLSGFYTEDLPMISECAEQNGFRYKYSNSLKNWMMAEFEKVTF